MFEEIENKWTEASGDYDDIIQRQLSSKRTVSYWTKELKRLLGPEPLRILEVGCGPGFMSIIAARLGHEVRAVDGSAGMVEKARRNMQHYHQAVEICQEKHMNLMKKKAAEFIKNCHLRRRSARKRIFRH
jgi:protein-L-isoaspartate O-methyltransferase